MSKYRSIYAEIPDKARIVWSFLSFLPALLLLALGQIIGVGVFMGIAFSRGDVSSAEELQPYLEGLTGTEPLLLLLPFLFVILVTLFWVRLIEGRSLATIGFTAAGWIGKYLRGFASGAAFLLVVVGVIFLGGGYDVEQGFPLSSSENSFAAISLILIFLGAFIVQGASEEVTFRGWWMSALAARRGKIVALIVTSVLFALLHLGNIWPPTTESMVGVANIVLFGLFIGLYALKERSLWGVCGWHSAWNWLLGLGFGLEVSGQQIDATPLIADLADKGGAPLLTGGGFGPEASLVTTLVLGLGCGWLVMRGALQDG